MKDGSADTKPERKMECYLKNENQFLRKHVIKLKIY
jgi:hypothetical protein